MFLGNLTDTQKPAFWVLAHTLVAADGILSNDEVSMMEQYKLEMTLTINPDESLITTEQAIDTFKTAPVTVKKQVTFELVALACADENYADEERHLLNKICTMIGLNTTFLDQCTAYVKELTNLYEKIGKLVSE